jgi:hypothetical protein
MGMSRTNSRCVSVYAYCGSVVLKIERQAVSEIKMIVWSLIAKATPRLVGNKYKIVDPLNITSVPPQGELILEPFSFA